MPNVETVELRPSRTESKLKKAAKLLKFFISFVNALSVIFRVVNFIWNKFSDTIKSIAEFFE